MLASGEDHPDELAIERLRARLDTREAELRRALERLEHSARSKIDFGRFVAEHAEMILGGAFVAGLLLGGRRR